jgi:hypothetical protein
MHPIMEVRALAIPCCRSPAAAASYQLPEIIGCKDQQPNQEQNEQVLRCKQIMQ